MLKPPETPPPCPACGGPLTVETNVCLNSFPCRHGAYCPRCTAKTAVCGSGASPGGCGPFFTGRADAIAARQAYNLANPRPAPPPVSGFTNFPARKTP